MLAKRNLIFTIKKYSYMAEAKSQMPCRYGSDFSTRVASVVILQRILMKFYLRQGNLSVHDLFATRCAFVVLK